jgi:antitoxin VapB
MIAQTQVPQDFLTAEDRLQGIATRDPFAGEE